MKLRHTEDYRKLRRESYPDIGDQLDAIYKLAQSLGEQGFPLPTEVTTWVSTVEAVKARYSKGSQTNRSLQTSEKLSHDSTK